MRSMNSISKILAGCATLGLLPLDAIAASSDKEARVTQIIRDVKLLPSEEAPRAAAVNDKVTEETGVRTGGESRSELTFPDMTITRLGANTIFSFNKAGHYAKLESGSLLLRVPKNSGGGNIKTTAVTVAVTGTTVILETARSGKSKLITLEGSGRLSLVNYPRESRQVRAGQMLDVPAGATTLPMPVDIDLDQVMKSHPLITDFKPLPSRDLIAAVIRDQPNSPSRGDTANAQPGGGSGRPSWLPNIGISIGGGGVAGGRPQRNPRNPRDPGGPRDSRGNTQGNPPKDPAPADPRGQATYPRGGANQTVNQPPRTTAPVKGLGAKAARPKPTPTPPVIR
jgi:hypothetical protein